MDLKQAWKAAVSQHGAESEQAQAAYRAFLRSLPDDDDGAYNYVRTCMSPGERA